MDHVARAACSFVLVVGFVVPVTAWARRCPADSVQVGDVCVDKYEASVWSTTDTATIKKIQRGKISSPLELVAAAQHGHTEEAGDDYGLACPDDGAGCTDFYAVSVAGVQPSCRITVFQAMAACRNAGKHLITNDEWQAAALGTPDIGTDNGMTDCHVVRTNPFPVPVDTGSRSSCVSDAGAFDMVGNVFEWVAGWVPLSDSDCTGWSGLSDDQLCVAGASTTSSPGVLVRGGFFDDGPAAGPFAAFTRLPQREDDIIGFRCARGL